MEVDEKMQVQLLVLNSDFTFIKVRQQVNIM